jgi:hypothetical protein
VRPFRCMEDGGVCMSRRLVALLGLLAFALGACGQVRTVQPASGGYRLYLAEGFGQSSSGVTIRDSATGALERRLPLGTPAPDWSRYYTVSRESGSAQVTALDPRTGKTVGQMTIPVAFVLPDLGYSGLTSGLSPNGQWLALISHGKRSGSTVVTGFLVGSSSLTSAFKQLQLDGDYDFDAISNDGKSLYLIQRLGEPGHYQVRLYDMATQSLAAQPVVDKREPDEPMNGVRGDSAADPLGNYVYTVYVRDGGPFIHALPLGEPIAWCIDLPAKSAGDMERQWRWALAVSRDGSTLYAANPMEGSIAVLTPGEPPKIARTGKLAMNNGGGLIAGLITDADAKGPLIGGAALSADGQTLFVVDTSGIVAVSTTTLRLRTRILGGESIQSIRLSSDGKWLYAVGASSTQVWQINPATGAVAEIKGSNNPWAVFWVEPN